MNKDYASVIKHIQSVSPHMIDMTLERISTVADHLQCRKFNCPVITIGGTNGKGTCVAALEYLYQQNGYKTAVFTSPHIHSHCELFRINGRDISATQFVEAIEAVDAARGSIALTEYEFLMLAGLILFQNAKPDVVILEVGMGGRDDVTNIIDPDVTVITNVALDHTQWLGDTREAIGAIKAGIFRKETSVILGETNPPQSILNHAQKLNCPTYKIGKDFDIHPEHESLACAIQAVKLLQSQLPAKACDINLSNLNLPGRFEVRHKPCYQILDVAHNPASAKRFADNLKKLNHRGPIHAVFSMFADKDIVASVAPLKKIVKQWHIAKLDHPRAAELPQLETALKDQTYTIYPSIKDAYQAVVELKQKDQLVLVFGSFQILALLPEV